LYERVTDQFDILRQRQEVPSSPRWFTSLKQPQQPKQNRDYLSQRNNEDWQILFTQPACQNDRSEFES